MKNSTECGLVHEIENCLLGKDASVSVKNVIDLIKSCLTHLSRHAHSSQEFTKGCSIPESVFEFISQQIRKYPHNSMAELNKTFVHFFTNFHKMAISKGSPRSFQKFYACALNMFYGILCAIPHDIRNMKIREWFEPVKLLLIRYGYEYLAKQSIDSSLKEAILALAYLWKETEIINVVHRDETDLSVTRQLNDFITFVLSEDLPAVPKYIHLLQLQFHRMHIFENSTNEQVRDFISRLFEKSFSRASQAQTAEDKTVSEAVADAIADNYLVYQDVFTSDHYHTLFENARFSTLKRFAKLISETQPVMKILIKAILKKMNSCITLRGSKRKSMHKDTAGELFVHLKKISQPIFPSEVYAADEEVYFRVLEDKYLSLSTCLRSGMSPRFGIDHQKLTEISKYIKNFPLEKLGHVEIAMFHSDIFAIYCIVNWQAGALSQTMDVLKELLLDVSHLHSRKINKDFRSSSLIVQICMTKSLFQVDSVAYRKMVMSYFLTVLRSDESFENMRNLILEEDDEDNMILYLEALAKGIKKKVGPSRTIREFFWRIAADYFPIRTVDSSQLQNHFKILKAAIVIASCNERLHGNNPVDETPNWRKSVCSGIDRILEINAEDLTSEDSMTIIKFLKDFWQYKASLLDCLSDEFPLAKKTLVLFQSLWSEKNDSKFAVEACIKHMIENCTEHTYQSLLDSQFEKIKTYKYPENEAFLATFSIFMYHTTKGPKKLEILKEIAIKFLGKCLMQLMTYNVNTLEFLQYSCICHKLYTVYLANRNIFDERLAVLLLNSLHHPFPDKFAKHLNYVLHVSIGILSVKYINLFCTFHKSLVSSSEYTVIAIANRIMCYFMLCADQEKETDDKLVEQALIAWIRLLKALIDTKKFSNILITVVSHFISQCTMVTLKPRFKKLLTSGVYLCMRTINKEALRNLQVSSHHNVRATFQAFLETYKRHYKYTGKV